MRIRDVAELRELITAFKSDTRDLTNQVHSIMWHMRGSLTRDDAWALSPDERMGILKQIEDRVKTIEKTGLAIL